MANAGEVCTDCLTMEYNRDASGADPRWNVEDYENGIRFARPKSAPGMSHIFRRDRADVAGPSSGVTGTRWSTTIGRSIGGWETIPHRGTGKSKTKERKRKTETARRTASQAKPTGPTPHAHRTSPPPEARTSPPDKPGRTLTTGSANTVVAGTPTVYSLYRLKGCIRVINSVSVMHNSNNRRYNRQAGSLASVKNPIGGYCGRLG